MHFLMGRKECPRLHKVTSMKEKLLETLNQLACLKMLQMPAGTSLHASPPAAQPHLVHTGHRDHSFSCHIRGLGVAGIKTRHHLSTGVIGALSAVSIFRSLRSFQASGVMSTTVLKAASAVQPAPQAAVDRSPGGHQHELLNGALWAIDSLLVLYVAHPQEKDERRNRQKHVETVRWMMAILFHYPIANTEAQSTVS